MRSDTMDCKFGKLHYAYSFSGKETTLLMLHAFHSSTKSYAPLCELLKNKFNIVCLDFPGHGFSARVDCQKYSWYYSIEGFTGILIDVIDQLQLTNFYIVGDSVGGNCAVRSMNTINGLLGLILMGSAQASSVDMVFSLHHQSKALELLFQKQRSETEDEIVAAAYVHPELNGGKNFQQMMYDIQHTDPDCREYFAQQIETQQWVDELQLIQHASVPLTYILGEDDGFINSLLYRDVLIKAGIKESHIHLIKQARHMPQLDNPEVVGDIIVDFAL